jgi:hypothetical protein
MTTIEQIETAIAKLSREEMARLRAWFDELEEQRFDEAIESSVKAGKLDKLIAEVQANIKAGLGEEF